MMFAPRLLLLALSVVAFAPGVAAAPENQEYRRSVNGEFLFKHYPPRALAAREQGQVGFRVAISNEGALTSCEVTKSSGFASLDNETCELIIRHAQFEPTRNGEGRRVASVRDGLVNWTLPANAPRVATAKGTRTASNDSEKIICKRSPRTGSLAGFTKQCLTKREWALAAGEARKTGERITEGGAYWDGKQD